MISVKKILLLVLTALVFFVPAAASAHPSNNSYVTGTVNYNGHHVGKGFKVEAQCGGHKYYGQTDKNGNYDIGYSSSQCRDNSNVVVNTDCYGVRGSSHWKQNHKNKQHKCNVNIECAQVPEFGLIEAIFGATLSIGAFLLIRRGRLGAN